jgi:hypothetical protein
VKFASYQGMRTSVGGLSRAFLIFGLLLAGSHAALASGVVDSAGGFGGANGKEPVSTDGLTFQGPYTPCNQECWYQAANRNLTLQSVYLTEKVDELEALKKKLDDNKTPAAERDAAESRSAEILGDACLDREVTKVTPSPSPGVNAGPSPSPTVVINSIGACRDRYIHTQEPILRQIREAIKHNEDAIAKLQNTRSPELALGIDPGAPPAGVGALKSAQPYLPTMEDLAKVYQKSMENGEISIKPQFNEWATDRDHGILKAPKAEDFVSVESAKIGGGNDSGKIRYIAVDQAGKAKRDAESFKAAEAAYKIKEKEKRSGRQSLADDRAEFKEMDEEVKKGTRKLDKDLNKAATKTQIEIFNKARLQWVNAGNKALKIPSKSDLAFGGKSATIGSSSYRSPSSSTAGSAPKGDEQLNWKEGMAPPRFTYDPEKEIDAMIQLTNPQ